MNLVFHTIFSISTSPICAKKIVEGDKPLKYLALGFIGNIIGHGVMDLVPHNYPLTMKTDLPISFTIFLLSIIFVKKEFLTSVFFCFLGGALPDLIDKGFLPIVGINNFKIFPWHWYTIINFFYDWYFANAWLFKIFNILSIIICICLLLLNQRFILQHMLKFIKKSNKKSLTN